MPHLDANALNSDPDGLAFLRDVLGNGSGDLPGPGRVFPAELWNPTRTRDNEATSSAAQGAGPSESRRLEETA